MRGNNDDKLPLIHRQNRKNDKYHLSLHIKTGTNLGFEADEYLLFYINILKKKLKTYISDSPLFSTLKYSLE